MKTNPPVKHKFIPIFVLFWLFTSTHSSAQSSTDLSFGYAPISSFRSIKQTNKDYSDLIVDILDSLDSPYLGGIIGLNVSHQFANNFRIGAGLSFKKLGKTITRQYRGYPNGTYSIAGFEIVAADDDSIIEDITKETYSYLSLSTFFGRTISLTNRFSITPMAGLEIDYLLDTKNSLEHVFMQYQNLVVSGTINVQLEYLVSKRFHFYLAPIYGHSFTSYSTLKVVYDYSLYGDMFDYQIKQYFYDYGVKFGLIYQLKSSE